MEDGLQNPAILSLVMKPFQNASRYLSKLIPLFRKGSPLSINQILAYQYPHLSSFEDSTAP